MVKSHSLRAAATMKLFASTHSTASLDFFAAHSCKGHTAWHYCSPIYACRQLPLLKEHPSASPAGHTGPPKPALVVAPSPYMHPGHACQADAPSAKGLCWAGRPHRFMNQARAASKNYWCSADPSSAWLQSSHQVLKSCLAGLLQPLRCLARWARCPAERWLA